MRDYDFMTECRQRANDPFDVSAERMTDDEIMQRAAWIRNAWQTDVEYRDLDPVAPLGTAPWYGGFLQRLGFAFVGGVFLLAPIWIMVLHRTRNTCLATTTAFVLVFGIILAWRMERPAEVLAATLAYAAVLVVIICRTGRRGGAMMRATGHRRYEPAV